MSQNRNPPAYQEYAAALLAQLPFRTMTLQDRGLLYTMRLECWVNVRLPSDHNNLAKVLGLQITEVANSLHAVMPFFAAVDGFIVSPELENYRAYLAERRLKQSQGGKAGSDITNNKRASKAEAKNDDIPSNPRVPHQGTGVSLVESTTSKQSQTQPTGRAVNVDPFIAEYQAAEHSLDYAQESRGR